MASKRLTIMNKYSVVVNVYNSQDIIAQTVLNNHTLFS
jgi:hypothetical protein